MSERPEVPVAELVDLAQLRADGRPPSPAQIRAALPRGWALSDDGVHAHRDSRLFFREGWILLVGLLVFGGVGGVFLWGGLPKGNAGLFRLLFSAVGILWVGGLVGPWITRNLNRR